LTRAPSPKRNCASLLSGRRVGEVVPRLERESAGWHSVVERELGVGLTARTHYSIRLITFALFKTTKIVGLPVGVSVLCPGWVRTAIMDADRNWPACLGEVPSRAPVAEVLRAHYDRAIGDGMDPAAVADLVAEAVVSGRFWILPHPEFVELGVRRWHRIAEGLDPDTAVDVPGFPPATQITSEIQAALTAPTR
jgi:hypothetical protein